MKKIVVGLCLVLALGVAGPMAEAKSLSKMLGQSGVAPEDFEMAGQAGRTLYAVNPPKVGQTVRWQNPKSGSTGTVKLVSMRNGCAQLQHVVTTSTGKVQPYESRLCQNAQGNWILTP